MDLIVGDALALLVWFNQNKQDKPKNHLTETGRIDQMNKFQCAMYGTCGWTVIVPERTSGMAP